MVKMGAPKNNLNAAKTGRHVRRLTLGMLPKQLERVAKSGANANG